MHSKLFAWARYINADDELREDTVLKWHLWRPGLASVCSGANAIKRGCEIWQAALRIEVQVIWLFEWFWSCDSAEKAACFMSCAGETLIFKRAQDLHRLRAERWFPPEGTPKIVSVKRPTVIMAGVVCAAISTKNKHCSRNLQTNASGTDTQVTMQSVTDLVVVTNEETEMVCVENVRNFVGTSKAETSCFQ